MTRYIIAVLVLIAALAAVFFAGKKAGKESEVIIQQAETIQTQHETIQTVKKSKVIAKNNASLERDALIDKL
jgi:uncharacterized protein YycO|tara:strand:- start:8659 stop:8874 length:216 start_codon:yes stop_codon:yes gene_type:complete